VLPLHEPLEELKVCPTRVVPETVGGELFDGGVAVAAASPVAPSAAPERTATTLTPQANVAISAAIETRRAGRPFARCRFQLVIAPPPE